MGEPVLRVQRLLLPRLLHVLTQRRQLLSEGLLTGFFQSPFSSSSVVSASAFASASSSSATAAVSSSSATAAAMSPSTPEVSDALSASVAGAVVHAVTPCDNEEWERALLEARVSAAGNGGQRPIGWVCTVRLDSARNRGAWSSRNVAARLFQRFWSSLPKSQHSSSSSSSDVLETSLAFGLVVTLGREELELGDDLTESAAVNWKGFVCRRKAHWRQRESVPLRAVQRVRVEAVGSDLSPPVFLTEDGPIAPIQETALQQAAKEPLLSSLDFDGARRSVELSEAMLGAQMQMLEAAAHQAEEGARELAWFGLFGRVVRNSSAVQVEEQNVAEVAVKKEVTQHPEVVFYSGVPLESCWRKDNRTRRAVVMNS